MKQTEKNGLQREPFGLTNNQLKIIAMLAMLTDHVGMILLPQVRVLRIIGRLAFPIFAFMIAEGCVYTRNRRNYVLKIGALALLCQIVYLIAEQSLYQCVLVTFTLSVLLIFSIDHFRRKRSVAAGLLMMAAACAVVFLTLILPQLLNDTDYGVDYGIWGVLLPVAVYYIPGKWGRAMASAVLLSLIGLATGGRQWYGLLAVPILLLYNGRRGKWKMKYLFYLFYPAHLGILYLISML